MQLREHQFNDWALFFWVHAHWNASTIIFNAHAAIGMHGDDDVMTMTTQSFIRGVINHLLDHVQWIISPGIHTWTLFDRFKSFKNFDR